MSVLLDILAAFWNGLGQMAPYLLFGFLTAGVLSVFISAETVERHLGGRGFLPVLKAAAFGVPLPLCSCGVIPVSASLRRHGASRGATTAFLISTPQTGVDSILATLSVLGPLFAIFRPVVALVSGLLGGLVATAVADERTPASPDAPAKAACTEACCSAEGGGRLRRALVYGFDTLPRDIGRSLLVGLLLAAGITALVPENFFEPLLGGGVGAMLLMMAIGIPVYVCATASVPVAAAMIGAGVSPGAALVFLMTGPATNAATIATIWKVMGRRTAVVYLATVALTALAAGLVLDYLFAVSGASLAGHRHEMPPSLLNLNSVAAVALLAVLIVAVVRSYLPGRAAAGHEHGADEGDEGMRTELHVGGMTCEHCRQAVQRALAECEGAERAEVDLATGRAVVTGPADPAALRQAVEALGYRVEPGGHS